MVLSAMRRQFLIFGKWSPEYVVNTLERWRRGRMTKEIETYDHRVLSDPAGIIGSRGARARQKRRGAFSAPRGGRGPLIPGDQRTRRADPGARRERHV